jgi:glycosyltransferase involved in cell wall biosynthesis
VINFFGVINSLGYGVFTHNLMLAYDQHVSPDIAFFPNPLFTPVVEDAAIKRWLENGKKFKKSDPSISIFQAQYLNQFCGSPMIGFPIFELDLFTELELQALRGLDVIFQPSSWGKKIVENHGFKNVYVVPGGYNPAIFQKIFSLEQKLKRIEEQGITFIHVGKFEARKSSIEILNSFLKSSEGHSRKINLIYHVSNPFDADWFKKLDQILISQGFIHDGRHYVRGHVKILIPQDRFQVEPVKLYQMADFGLWASKAEGWNLPLLECLACGVPCITTDNTAQGDFIRNGIFPSELVLKSHQKEPTRIDGKWWPIDQQELIGKITSMISDPEKYLRLGDMCYQSVKDFTWENAAKRLGEVMQKIS